MTTEPWTSVQPAWALRLPLQQQSVLLLAARGPDGIPKTHPCKEIQRAYRGTVFVAARRGRLLEWGEREDSFMSMDVIADDHRWRWAIHEFFLTMDELPHHFYMHLMHGAEILGYKHPDTRIQSRWLAFYHRVCADLHVTPETEEEMDLRLSDWDGSGW